MALGESPYTPFYGIEANGDNIQVADMSIERAGIGFQCPDFAVPDGYRLVVMSHPQNTPLNYVYVGDSKGKVNNANPRGVIPLGPGQTVPLRLKNAKSLWVSGSSVGDIVIFYSERVFPPPPTSPYKT